jgi:hypothetical protein
MQAILTCILPLLLFKMLKQTSEFKVSDSPILGILYLKSLLTTCTELHQQPYHDEGYEDFRDFVNFIDGVGLSAQWTPEYDFDWIRLGESHQESRHSREPEEPQSPGPEDIGTPFSTWLPSAPADDDQVHLRSQAGDGKRITYKMSRKYLADLHRQTFVRKEPRTGPTTSRTTIATSWCRCSKASHPQYRISIYPHDIR